MIIFQSISDFIISTMTPSQNSTQALLPKPFLHLKLPKLQSLSWTEPIFTFKKVLIIISNMFPTVCTNIDHLSKWWLLFDQMDMFWVYSGLYRANGKKQWRFHYKTCLNLMLKIFPTGYLMTMSVSWIGDFEILLIFLFYKLSILKIKHNMSFRMFFFVFDACHFLPIFSPLDSSILKWVSLARDPSAYNNFNAFFR